MEKKTETMSKKMTGIVAYITWIGWIIAYISGDTEGAKFHLNQALVIHLIGLVGFIPVVGRYLWIFATILWFIGFTYATREEEKPVPIVGSIEILK